MIDVNPRDGATAESIAGLLSRGGQSLRGLAGVRNVLALEGQPFDRERDQPCLVACLGPAKGAAVDHERLVEEIRAVPPGEQAPSIRIRDLSGAAGSLRSGYSIHFAIVGPDRARAQTLAGQTRDAAVARPALDRSVERPSARVCSASVDIDRVKAAAMGVSPAEISAWIEPDFGPALAGSLKCFGQTLPIWVEVDSGPRHRYRRVRTAQGPQRQGRDGARPFDCHASPGSYARPARADRSPPGGIDHGEPRWRILTGRGAIRLRAPGRGGPPEGAPVGLSTDLAASDAGCAGAGQAVAA